MKIVKSLLQIPRIVCMLEHGEARSCLSVGLVARVNFVPFLKNVPCTTIKKKTGQFLLERTLKISLEGTFENLKKLNSLHRNIYLHVEHNCDS